MLVLGIAAAFSWHNVYAYELERLDEGLCSEARRFSDRPPPPIELARVQADIAPKLRLPSAAQVLIGLPNAVDRIAAQGALSGAEHWPADLDPDQLKWTPSDQNLPTNPGARPPRPPRQNEAASDEENNAPPPLKDDYRAPKRPGDDGDSNSQNDGATPQRIICEHASFTTGGSDWRVARIKTVPLSAVVAANLAATRDELQTTLRPIALRAIPLALLLAALGAWLLSALAMRPVNRLRQAMDSVHEKALDHRIPLDREDHEFKALITTYNRMLERLERSFHHAARFSSDAAHELRTPLTILQGQIEQAMRVSTGVSGHESIQIQLAQMLDEVGRLASITRKLLFLSQADAGKLALVLAPLDLRSMLNARLADAAMLEPDHALITSEIGRASCRERVLMPV